MRVETWMRSLKGSNVFVTGHTGFKGSWTCLVLEKLGANVTGYALSPPTNPSLFELARLRDHVRYIEGDIRDFETLSNALRRAEPEIIIHMAAQTLVLTGYQDPKLTFETNVAGTWNLLEAIRDLSSVRALVNVTSDKCYENREWLWSYRENDRLGGREPYSASKACSELVTTAYRESFFRETDRVGIASARAGNVIGGGDWSEYRIVPDCVRALTSSTQIQVRNASAIRPWQHVLEPVVGYLTLACALRDDPTKYNGAWNFGPAASGHTVRQLVERFVEYWDAPADISYGKPQPGEAVESTTLRVSSEKARIDLGWQPRWGFDEAIERTAVWYREVCLEEREPAPCCRRQIDEYLSRDYPSQDYITELSDSPSRPT